MRTISATGRAASNRRVVAGRREQLALQRGVVELIRTPMPITRARRMYSSPAGDPNRSGDHALARPTGAEPNARLDFRLRRRPQDRSDGARVGGRFGIGKEKEMTQL